MTDNNWYIYVETMAINSWIKLATEKIKAIYNLLTAIRSYQISKKVKPIFFYFICIYLRIIPITLDLS